MRRIKLTVAYDGTAYKGVANCGPRPTFGEDSYTLEVYFEGLSEDLYGKPD